jgi:6-phosphogluconate dehydrogenase
VIDLSQNMERSGYAAAVHNRTTQTMHDFVAVLEEPLGVLTLDLREPPEQIVAEIVRQL